MTLKVNVSQLPISMSSMSIEIGYVKAFSSKIRKNQEEMRHLQKFSPVSTLYYLIRSFQVCGHFRGPKNRKFGDITVLIFHRPSEMSEIQY